MLKNLLYAASLVAPCLVVPCLVAPGAAHAVDGYHLAREVAVPGEGAAYDYVQFLDGRLFVGHRPDGLQVFDTVHDFAMTTVDASKGSNGATLMPDLGLGVSHNTDGTLTVFTLADLKLVRSIKLGAELDSSRYDPVTHRLAVFGVPPEGGAGGQVVVLQAPAMDVVGKATTEAAKLEHSAADGTGILFLAAQDQNAILKFDMTALKVTATWPTPCKQPTGLAYDAQHRRLMIGCRGEITEPMFVVMNADTGAVVFKGPLGMGNDGVVYDAARARVIATNGVGANLVVYAQTGADGYAIEEVVGTRMMAKTVALDPASGDVYTILAEGVFDPSRRNLTYVTQFYPNGFTRNSFRILKYSR